MKLFFFLILLTTLGTTTSCQKNQNTTVTPGNASHQKEIAQKTKDKEHCKKITHDHVNCMTEALKEPDSLETIHRKCAEEAITKNPTNTEAIKTALSECVERTLTQQKEKEATDPDGKKAISKCTEQALEYVKKNIQTKKMKTSLEKIITASGAGPPPGETSGICAGARKNESLFLCVLERDIWGTCFE